MNLAHSSRSIVLGFLVIGCGGATADGGSQVDASSDAGGGAGSGVAGAGGSVAGTGGAGGGTSGGAAGNAGTGGAGGGPSDAGGCNPACTPERKCCAGKCVNTANDPTNCGACGDRCQGATSFCGGTCMTPPCELEAGSCNGGSCCGTECCSQGQLCCDPQGPLDRGPVCYTPTADQPTCPQGCAPLCISDRALKRDVEPVDPRAVLDALSRMPVSTWSYRTDPASVRHMGPMAQDFKAAFGLGDTDRAYHSIDAHGVSIAAIQALYEMSLEQGRRIERLERENELLQRRLSSNGRDQARSAR